MATPSVYKDVNDPSFIVDTEKVADTDRFFGGTAGDLPRSRTRKSVLQGTPGASVFSVDPVSGQITCTAASGPVGGILWGDPSLKTGFETSVTPGPGQIGWTVTLPNSNNQQTPVGALMMAITPSTDTGDSYQRGIWAVFENGYQGFAETSVIDASNLSAMPTGAANAWPGSSDANGLRGSSIGAGINGMNVGVQGYAVNAKKNFGGFFWTSNNESLGGYDVGCVGYSQTNGTGTNLHVGLCGVVGNNSVIIAQSAAAVFDSTNTGFPVALFQVGGSVKSYVDVNGSIVCAPSVLATNATKNFLYLPSCAGTPTGTPVSNNGVIPCVVDTINKKLWAYVGGSWVSTQLA